MAKKIIIKGFTNREMEKLLISRGVPPQDLPSRNVKIDIEEALVKVEPDIPNVMARPITVMKQYRFLESFIEHPLRSSSTMAISSFPSDLRAKHLAIYLMSIAIAHHREGHHKPGRSMPLWHRVFGGWTDNLRDKPVQDLPSLLIIANVHSNSSPVKIEKVRDLLERFSEIPKIVVTGGEPPHQLFATKLFYPLRAGIYLGPDNRIKEIN